MTEIALVEKFEINPHMDFGGFGSNFKLFKYQ